MDREVLVYVDLNGVPYLVGRLWARTRKNTEGATFEYDARWLEHRERFSLEPALNEDDNTASLDVAMGVAPYFELDDARARADAGAVARAVTTWRDEATRHGLTKRECARMASAFEHDDLEAALAFGS